MKVKIFKSFQGSGRSKIGDKPFETLITLDEGEFIEDGEKYEFISANGQPLTFLKKNIKFENEETLLLSSSWNETFIHCNLLLEKKKIGNPFIITGYRDIWDGEPFHLIVRVEEEKPKKDKPKFFEYMKEGIDLFHKKDFGRSIDLFSCALMIDVNQSPCYWIAKARFEEGDVWRALYNMYLGLCRFKEEEGLVTREEMHKEIKKMEPHLTDPNYLKIWNDYKKDVRFRE